MEESPGRMAPRGPEHPPAASLSADEFAARFQESARLFWTLAAGILGDPSEAEDVCQEAVLAALGKLGGFDRDTCFRAWMGSFVRNVATNEMRKRVRRRTASADPLRLDGSAEGQRSSVLNGAHAREEPHGGWSFRAGRLVHDGGDFDDHVLAGLSGLGELARSCLLLRVLHGLSYAEIAGLLGIPEGTAMSHVHRSRLALRDWLVGAEVPRREEERLAPEVNP